MNIKQRSQASENFKILRLMRLTSPSLPIGAYAYSQGLETAVESGWVHDAPSVLEWVEGLLKHPLTHLDVPVLKRLYQAWQKNQNKKVLYWNQYILASRDSFEFHEEDRQLGKSLSRLLVELGLEEVKTFFFESEISFLTSYSLAAVSWNIPLEVVANGLLWMWAENQVLVAIKTVPLGQTDGQKILSRMIEVIPNTVKRGLALVDQEIGYTAPAHGIAGALHETQYSRLFRS